MALRVYDYVFMDEICWQVVGVSDQARTGDYVLRRIAGGTIEEGSESLVPIPMLRRLIALGEVTVARDVNAEPDAPKGGN